MTPQHQNKLIESRLKKESPEKILYDLMELNKKEIANEQEITDMVEGFFEKDEENRRIFEENKFIILLDLIAKLSRIFRQKITIESIIWLEENFEIFPKESILKKYRK